MGRFQKSQNLIQLQKEQHDKNGTFIFELSDPQLFLHGIHYVSTLESPKQYAEINFVKKLEILLPKLKFLPKK